MTQYSTQVEVTAENKIVAIKNKRYNSQVITIQWFIGTRCQYECQYCSPEWHSKTAPHWSLDNLKLAWQNLCNANQHRPDVKFLIAISGGEPTMNPDFLPWVKWLHETQSDKLYAMSVATNATQTVEYYKELSTYVKGIMFGLHSEYVAEKRFFKLVEEVNNYAKEHNHCSICVLLPDEYWHTDRTKLYIEYLNHLGIYNRVLPLHDFNPGKQPKPVKLYNRMDFNETSFVPPAG